MDINTAQNFSKKPKSTIFHWVAIVALFSILAVSILINIIMMMGLAIDALGPLDYSETKFAEEHISGSGKTDKFVQIDVSGIISYKSQGSLLFEKEDMTTSIIKQIQAAKKDSSVKGIFLVVDSPGGGVTASDVIYHNLKLFKKSGNGNRPVVVLMRDLAASGGYYISAAADKIVAHPTTITGSIGVIMSSANVKGLTDKLGIKSVNIKSGKNKDMLNPMLAINPEGTNIIQIIIDEMYLRFAEIVADGRDLPLEKVKELADGRIYTAAQAFRLGLIDQIGYREDALKLLAKISGCSKYKLIRYKKEQSLSDILSAKFNPSLKLPMNLNAVFNEPKMMYLWNPQL